MSDNRERTPWFPGSVKPKRPGVYERKYLQEVAFSRWNGREWLCGYFAAREHAIDRAAATRTRSFNQSVPWRGLSQDPQGGE